VRGRASDARSGRSRQPIGVIRFRVALLVLLASVASGCAPTASSPTPTVSFSPTATASRTSAAGASPSAIPRIQISDEPLSKVAGAFVLFQLLGETRLRAISYGAEVSGSLAGQIASDVAWSQSPYGLPYRVAGAILDRAGRSLGTLPWSAPTTPTWSSDGRLLCAALPEGPATGAQMRLETAIPGQPAKVIASGFMTYGDNATYPVLACDESTDRVIVASFGQGVAPSRLVVFRLSTGAVIRSIDYAGRLSWVAASADGTMLVETHRRDTASGRWSATIRYADDGTEVGALDGFVVQGFSGDNTLLVGASESSAAVVDWKTGRAIWNTSGPYGGFLAEPAGRRLVVGIGFVGGSDQRDVYLVGTDGSALLFPARVRVALRY